MKYTRNAHVEKKGAIQFIWIYISNISFTYICLEHPTSPRSHIRFYFPSKLLHELSWNSDDIDDDDSIIIKTRIKFNRQLFKNSNHFHSPSISLSLSLSLSLSFALSLNTKQQSAAIEMISMNERLV